MFFEEQTHRDPEPTPRPPRVRTVLSVPHCNVACAGDGERAEAAAHTSWTSHARVSGEGRDARSELDAVVALHLPALRAWDELDSDDLHRAIDQLPDDLRETYRMVTTS